MFSLLKSMGKPFSTGNSQQPQGQPGTSPGRSDRLEDGFLLVGDTASERTTVHASQFRADLVDAPPGYRDSTQGEALPTYTDYRSNITAFSPTLDVSQYPGIQYGNPMQTGSPTVQAGSSVNRAHAHENPVAMRTSDSDANRNAISDVPFVLGASVFTSGIIQDIKTSNILYQRTFDISNYEYDFNLEMAYLCEHGGFQGDDAMDVN